MISMREWYPRRNDNHGEWHSFCSGFVGFLPTIAPLTSVNRNSCFVCQKLNPKIYRCKLKGNDIHWEWYPLEIEIHWDLGLVGDDVHWVRWLWGKTSNDVLLNLLPLQSELNFNFTVRKFLHTTKQGQMRRACWCHVADFIKAG